MVLGYNLMQVIRILGIKAFRGYRALKKRTVEASLEGAATA